MRSGFTGWLCSLGLAASLASSGVAQQAEQVEQQQGPTVNGVQPVGLFGHHRGVYVMPNNCPNCQTPPPPIQTAPTTPIAPPPKTDAAPAPEAPVPEPLTSAALGDTSTAVAFNPTMFGDLLSSSRVRSSSSSSSFGRRATSSSRSSSSQGFPRASAAGFRISDNSSPRPMDRIYFTYNHFGDVNAGTGTAPFDVNRETIGIEKTLLGGNASVGVRLPFQQASTTFGGLQGSQVGDISLYGKYAIVNDPTTGDVLSIGLGLTLPTGDSIRDASGKDYNTTLYQPFIGWIKYFSPDFFAQAFHSMVIADASRDVSAVGNDIALGYWLYRGTGDSLIRGVIPTIEGHLYDPLNHRGSSSNAAFFANDTFTLTGGVSFAIGNRSLLGLALAAPLTGPRPNDWEGIVTFNLRY